jgi:hypothetical protein
MLGIPVNPAQEAALMRGMAVLQKNRFQSVSELYNALYNVQTDMPITTYSSAAAPIATAPEPSIPQTQAAPQAYAPTPVYTPVSVPTPEPALNPTPGLAPEVEKPKRMTKQKWIMAIACGLLAGILSFAWSMWQSSNNRAETPDRPAVSPPVIELPGATDSLTGTWVSVVDYGGDSINIELLFDEGGGFYLLEVDLEYDFFIVSEGTYTISGSRLQMIPLWVASIADFWSNGYNVYDTDSFSIETTISIDSNALHIDSLGFGMAYVDVILTRGVSSGLWSFEDREKLLNMSTPESQSPRDTTHIANVTLGDFQHFGDSRSTQRGWFSVGTDDLWSDYTSSDFSDSQYLIIEFDREPYGEIEFAWIGDSNDWVWTSTAFFPQERILIIDLTQINGYNLYRQAYFLKIYICCYYDSWDDLTITDAYFADAR